MAVPTKDSSIMGQGKQVEEKRKVTKIPEVFPERMKVMKAA
jgi:hypothetical protein